MHKEAAAAFKERAGVTNAAAGLAKQCTLVRNRYPTALHGHIRILKILNYRIRKMMHVNYKIIVAEGGQTLHYMKQQRLARNRDKRFG